MRGPFAALRVTLQEQDQKTKDKINYPAQANNGLERGTRIGCALVEAVKLGGGLEFAVEMAVDDLHEEFAQVGEARGGQRLGPLLFNDAIDGIAEDEGGEGAGLEGHLRAGDAAVVAAGESVAQCVEEGGLAGERGGAFDAGVERGKKAHEAEHPEIEVGDGQPDGAGFQRLEDGPGEAEDAVVGFAVGQELVEHFGDVGEGDAARVVHG